MPADDARIEFWRFDVKSSEITGLLIPSQHWFISASHFGKLSAGPVVYDMRELKEITQFHERVQSLHSIHRKNADEELLIGYHDRLSLVALPDLTSVRDIPLTDYPAGPILVNGEWLALTLGGDWNSPVLLGVASVCTLIAVSLVGSDCLMAVTQSTLQTSRISFPISMIALQNPHSNIGGFGLLLVFLFAQVPAYSAIGFWVLAWLLQIGSKTYYVRLSKLSLVLLIPVVHFLVSLVMNFWL